MDQTLRTQKQSAKNSKIKPTQKKEKTDISQCAILDNGPDFQKLAEKNFYIPTHKNIFAACHIDFFHCLYTHYKKIRKGIRTSLHKEYFIAPDRFKEWNNMLATPTLGKIEEICSKEHLEVEFVLEHIDYSESMGYEGLEFINNEDADNYLTYKFGDEYLYTRSINAQKHIHNLPPMAQEILINNNKVLPLSPLLLQFAYIYYSFHDKIDHILNEKDKKEEESSKDLRMSTSAVISEKADWNISMKRILINRPATSFSLENVDKFTQNITLPLKYAIRLVPSKRDRQHLTNYEFTPYNQLNLKKRELIHFFDKKSADARLNI